MEEVVIGLVKSSIGRWRCAAALVAGGAPPKIVTVVVTQRKRARTSRTNKNQQLTSDHWEFFHSISIAGQEAGRKDVPLKRG